MYFLFLLWNKKAIRLVLKDCLKEAENEKISDFFEGRCSPKEIITFWCFLKVVCPAKIIRHDFLCPIDLYFFLIVYLYIFDLKILDKRDIYLAKIQSGSSKNSFILP
ncbi:hypothetical protein BU251_03455 [Candidatus Velamenicoccus archaeovorus]|uniref:Uncharacterized protein n=1 Tax=Velamenicoccus archaeovorus TaxID=1930593 RepID=A0A410P3T5_VELA1|nr:hypothetical protein BU251_03455 [Candidatus Velamenicoccus archaeovorus]